MNPVMAHVRLQYRPAADVLSLRSDFDHPDLVDAVDGETESIDSDTMVCWTAPRRGQFENLVLLRSFSIIGARKRFSPSRRPDFVPEGLWSTAVSLFGTTVPRGTPDRVAALAKAEARRSVDVSELVRSGTVESSGLAEVSVARSLASATRRLSRALDGALTSDSNDGHESGSPPRAFVRDLDQLASVVAAHRRPVPSVVNDLLSNLRGGLPLTQTERARVRRALKNTLDVGQWRAVATDLMTLAEAIAHYDDYDNNDDTTDNE